MREPKERGTVDKLNKLHSVWQRCVRCIWCVHCDCMFGCACVHACLPLSLCVSACVMCAGYNEFSLNAPPPADSRAGEGTHPDCSSGRVAKTR